MVDGETYECVKSFCYMEDTLGGDGGADLAATARITKLEFLRSTASAICR